MGSLQTDYATWLSVFNVNLFGAAILSRTLYPPRRVRTCMVISE